MDPCAGEAGNQFLYWIWSFYVLQQDPEIITGGPVMWQINISGSLRFFFFFACTMKRADQKCGFYWKIREHLSVQHLPPPTQQSVGSRSFNLLSPCPKPWAVALGTSWGLPANPSHMGNELLPCGSGMGCPMEQLPIHLPSPIRSILFVFKLSLRVCRAALGWLCSQLHPLMSVGLRWWNQEKNLAPRRFIPPLLFFFLTFFFFLFDTAEAEPSPLPGLSRAPAAAGVRASPLQLLLLGTASLLRIQSRLKTYLFCSLLPPSLFARCKAFYYPGFMEGSVQNEVVRLFVLVRPIQ